MQGLLKRTLLLSFVFITACLEEQNTLNGTVVKIADGDTLTLLTADKKRHRIRLGEIDAPERKQAYGRASQKALTALCAKQKAVVRILDTDQYDRIVGRVECKGIDANEEQVRTGMAWVYPQHVRDRSLYALQDQAKKDKKGLWRDKTPIPPWEYRKR